MKIITISLTFLAYLPFTLLAAPQLSCGPHFVEIKKEENKLIWTYDHGVSYEFSIDKATEAEYFATRPFFDYGKEVIRLNRQTLSLTTYVSHKDPNVGSTAPDDYNCVILDKPKI